MEDFQIKRDNLYLELFNNHENQFKNMKNVIKEIQKKLEFFSKEINEKEIEFKKKSKEKIKNLQKEELNILKEFKKEKNFNEKIQKNFEKLNSNISNYIELNEQNDEYSNKLNSNLLNLYPNSSKEIQISLEIESKNLQKNLSKSINQMKKKNLFGFFISDKNNNISMNIKSFFELIFEYLPKNFQIFNSLSLVSKEFQSCLIFKKWNIMTLKNSNSFKNCKNISILIINEKNPKIENLIEILKKFKIKEIIDFESICISNSKEIENFVNSSKNKQNFQSIESITLINSNLYLLDFVKIIEIGISNLKLFNCFYWGGEMKRISIDVYAEEYIDINPNKCNLKSIMFSGCRKNDYDDIEDFEIPFKIEKFYSTDMYFVSDLSDEYIGPSKDNCTRLENVLEFKLIIENYINLIEIFEDEKEKKFKFENELKYLNEVIKNLSKK